MGLDRRVSSGVPDAAVKLARDRYRTTYSPGTHLNKATDHSIG